MVRANWTMDASNAPYRSCPAGLRSGSVQANTTARSSMAAAEIKNTICHDESWVMKLDTGRANMMPSIKPLITLPTTRPRTASGARCAA
ncbi:hypothetical protein D9M69_557190 [compost metagenome]